MSRISQQAWEWLGHELDRWSAAGQKACFWWRDDDATAADDALSRLIRLAAEFRVPLALAVIPARCETELTGLVGDNSAVSVLQHGYAHINHALPRQLKRELGGQREMAHLLADLQTGYERLDELFGEQFCPALVPPWNRIDSPLLADLSRIGLRGLSTYRVRKQAWPAPGLLQVNAHLDPINWRHDRGFIGIWPALAHLVQHLAAKRSGYRDADEPTGILSHHLVQNEATWHFLEQLLTFLTTHPAVVWRNSHTIWAPR